MKTGTKQTMTAQYHKTRFDLSEGREWAVTSDTSGNTYLVTFYKGEQGKRFGYCSCAAASFDQPCKHLIFAAGCDSVLTRIPMRDVSELKRAA